MKLTMLIASACLLLAACATVPPAPPSKVERFTRPDVGVVTTKEVGEPLFEVEVATRFTGLKLTAGRQMPFTFGSTITFASDELTMFRGKQSAYCGPATMRPVMGIPSQIPFFCVTEDQLRKAGVAYTVGEITRNDPANYRQQLLYQGKSGSSLRLSYREFSGDLARPAFTQDLTFDLAESNVIGAKGARVEVLEATNTSIRYRLLQPFSSAPSPTQ